MLTLAVAVWLTTGCEQRAADPMLAAVADRQAIDQLIAGDYPRALDSADWEAYADNFTADGELTLLGQTAKGREAIIAMVGALPADNRVVHVITNLSYRIQGDGATGGAYWQDVGMADNRPAVVAAGHYEDTLRKMNGEWKIAAREIVIEFVPIDAAAPAPAERP
jgi:uncharacterized protein (TIGR02246 family)